MQVDDLDGEKSACGRTATMPLKQRVFEMLEVAALGDHASRLVDLALLGLIALNAAAFVTETIQPLHNHAEPWFRAFEVFSVLVFSMEYLLRLWSCTASPAYASPLRGRFRFAITPLAVIDLLAIAPFYLPFLDVDLRVIRIVRLFRLFRIAKLSRYSIALQTFGRVLAAKKEELIIILFILFLLLLMASSLMYFAEHDVQPEHFSSIPAAMWWGVATLTTVGYGDVYPATGLGKVIASMIAILGIGMFALPTGILGAAFVEELQQRRSGPRQCPHCGRTLND